MTTRDNQRAPARAGCDCYFHRVGTMPALAGDARVTDQAVRDRAVADLDDLMGPVPAQPGDAIAAHGEPHPGAPAETLLVAGQRLDHHATVDAGDTAKMLADDG